MYQKRAELLSELYGLVNELHGLGYQFGGTYIFGSNKRAKDRANDAREKIREIQIFFLKNRIYFSIDICNLVAKFIEVISDTLDQYDSTFNSLEEISIKENELEQQKEFSKQLFEAEQNLSSLKKRIEDEFRSILGVK